MPRPRSPNPKRPFRRLYIGEWLARLDKKQVEAATAAGVTPTYINEIVSGKKTNPSHEVLLDLSEWLGLTVNDFYYPPPTREQVDTASKDLTAAEMAALGNLLAKIERKARK